MSLRWSALKWASQSLAELMLMPDWKTLRTFSVSAMAGENEYAWTLVANAACHAKSMTVTTWADLHDALSHYSSPETVKSALVQVSNTLRAEPSDSALLENAAFDLVPYLLPLCVYSAVSPAVPLSGVSGSSKLQQEADDEERQRLDCSLSVQNTAKQALLDVADMASSAREVVLALLERLQMLYREPPDQDDLQEDGDSVTNQVTSIIQAYAHGQHFFLWLQSIRSCFSTSYVQRCVGFSQRGKAHSHSSWKNASCQSSTRDVLSTKCLYSKNSLSWSLQHARHQIWWNLHAAFFPAPYLPSKSRPRLKGIHLS